MEGKLIKTGKSNYTIIYKKEDMTVEHDLVFDGKLSLKNCEAIENGYDLDELAEQNWRIGLEEYIPTPATHVTSFKAGFQKALEILGDKKFSEADMKYFAGFAIGYTKNGIQSDTENVLDDKLKSLQQTEWDVEVEQELIQSSIEGEAIWKTKLDADGCLILKRK